MQLVMSDAHEGFKEDVQKVLADASVARYCAVNVEQRGPLRRFLIGAWR